MLWFSQFHHEVDTLKSILNKNSYPRDFGKRTDFFFSQNVGTRNYGKYST